MNASSIAALLTALCATLGAAPLAPPARVLHTTFDTDRVYVTVRTRNGATLDLYTDTGGGMLLSADAARRAGLEAHAVTDSATVAQLGPGAAVADAPRLAPDEPAPAFPVGQQIAVVPAVAEVPGWPAQGDGIVGQAWFAGHVWTWDYPGHRLVLRPAGWRPSDTRHALAVGFKHAGGHRVLDFPRIVVRVDGDSLSMLLDTGAETMLSAGALAALHDGRPAFRATSMIAHAVFARWHAAHPDWPVVDSAQAVTHSRMIRVPRVEIAGLATGPVWFTERSDASYRQYMSAMTDREVEGSLGGNALADFRMTLDYPRARAWFTCVRDCRPA